MHERAPAVDFIAGWLWVGAAGGSLGALGWQVGQVDVTADAELFRWFPNTSRSAWYGNASALSFLLSRHERCTPG